MIRKKKFLSKLSKKLRKKLSKKLSKKAKKKPPVNRRKKPRSNHGKKKKSGFLKISKKKLRGNIHTHKMDCVPCVLHHMGMDEEFSRLISQTAQDKDQGVTKESLIELLESYYKDYLFFLETKSFENYEEMYRELIKLFKKMHNNMHITALLEGSYQGEIWNHAVVFMKYKGEKVLIDVQQENFHYDIPGYLEKYNVTTISLLDSKHRITGERLVIKDTDNEEKNISFVSHLSPLSPAFPPDKESEFPDS